MSFRVQWEKFKQVFAMKLANELAKAAPVDTGRMKNSIDSSVDGNTIVINMVEYALYVEFGTPPHIITPKNAKALHWKSGQDDVFAKVVHHPGTRPQPFIRSTLNNKTRKLIAESVEVAFDGN